MNNFVLAFKVVFPLFASMMLGYIVKELDIVKKPTIEGINKLVFKVFLPLMLFSNIIHTDINKDVKPDIMIFSVIIVLAIYSLVFIVMLFLEKENKRRSVLIQATFRSNFIIFGLPMTASIYGSNNVGSVAILVAILVPLYNVLAVVTLEVFRGSKINIKNIVSGIITNPLIISAISSILILALKIKLPNILDSWLLDTSKVASPLALFGLGATFSFHASKKLLRQLIIGVLGKLIILPAIGITISILYGYRSIDLAALLAMFASPVAVSSYTMAEQMGADGELAGQLVVFTSFFSILTIFVWVLVLKSYNFL